MISCKLIKFLDGFLFPAECVFEKGHHGDYDHVTWENVSGDTGGVTKWGIDQASHPGINIKALDRDGAIAIYAKDYWDKCKCEEIKEPLCYVVMDIAVNNGVGRAAEWLQGIVIPDEVDGWIGNRTIAAANRFPEQTAQKLLQRRESFYREIAQQASKRKFLQGWLNRNNNLTKYIA